LKVKRSLTLLAILFGCLTVQSAWLEYKDTSTRWFSMKKGRVVLRSVKQRSLTLPVRIAETAAQRRGGFQNT